MNTVITTLPIYDKLAKQTYERDNAGEHSSGEGLSNVIISARHRLPSFQWIDATDGAASVTKVEVVDTEGTATDITAKFTLPAMIPIEHDYFTYKGTTLNSLLDAGTYYLKITMNNAKVYYSEWFKVDCVFGSDTGLPPTANYSTKYLVITFYNSCDLGNLYYHNSFVQVLYLDADTMEPSFPLEEKGANDGNGKFIRTWGRQVKKYTVHTKTLPGYMVEVFNRMKLHDTITLRDLVGDLHSVYNLEVEHEWLYDDKFYARLTLTFDYDEAFVTSGCCVNIS